MCTSTVRSATVTSPRPASLKRASRGTTQPARRARARRMSNSMPVRSARLPPTLTSRVWGGQTYDELQALGGFLIGAPDQVAAGVARLEAIGVDTLLLVCSFGNLAHEQVCRSLELFAAAVMR